ncbi:MAG: flagellar motor switch protein FliM [Pelotomaculum sp.]|uniref:Flagellar motor switch protein FliM n=1 Tax=Pelotomaculum thermopropionicum (strain DSM 13744 / JCM 10971 / SI) TaxID=370438 RepID=A5D0K2_PELTS|nr:flagellar motor switch protein FliM [Pelotomaculum sp.]BAF60242.1 flagellar motor switch protein [Pelotomaculum thermopropionicum SI]
MDVLSQSEIDALLSALSTGEVKIEELKETQQQVEYKRYDFRRPNKFSKDQLRTLQVLHGVFARLLSNFLTGYLRSNVQIEVASVDQLTYEDFIRSIPTPTVLAIFSLNPLKGTAIAQLDSMFLFPIIDLFFGGNGEAPKAVRELTDIELSVVRKISMKILEHLALAWKDIVHVEPVIETVETNPYLHQIFSFSEIVALITLTTQVGESARGFINLCLPFPLLDPVVSQLSFQRRFGPQTSAVNDEEVKRLQYWLGFPKIELTVLAGQTQITVDDFLQLQEGDVLILDKKVDQDLDLYIGEHLKFKVQAGALGSKLAVQITALATEGEKNV